MALGPRGPGGSRTASVVAVAMSYLPVSLVDCIGVLGPARPVASRANRCDLGKPGSLWLLRLAHSFLSPRRTFSCGTLAAIALRRLGFSWLALMTFRYRRPWSRHSATWSMTSPGVP